jgi:hypothetical protein
MFRPFYNGHLQASILGGAVNTIVIRNIRDLVSRVKSAVYYHIFVCLLKYRAMEAYAGVTVYLHAFLMSSLD